VAKKYGYDLAHDGEMPSLTMGMPDSIGQGHGAGDAATEPCTILC
jgi:hypothetical protein